MTDAPTERSPARCLLGAGVLVVGGPVLTLGAFVLTWYLGILLLGP